MTTTRRSLLKRVGATSIVAVTAGCTSASSDEEEDDEGDDQTETDEDESEFERQLETISEAIDGYEDIVAAIDDGYEFGGPYVPGMGWHVTNLDYLEAAAENGPQVDQPPMLTYVETDAGLALGSVEYAVPTDAVDEPPSLFADEDADREFEVPEEEGWHPHEAATHVFALGDDEQATPDELTLEELRTRDAWTEFHPPDETLEAGDTVTLDWDKGESAPPEESDGEERTIDLVNTHPGLHTLHVWISEENPNGLFAPFNSRFAADDEDDGHGHDHDHDH